MNALNLTWMPITERERTTIAQLLRCRLPAFSWDRRFLTDLQTKKALNHKQRAQLARIERQHRKQLHALEVA